MSETTDDIIHRTRVVAVSVVFLLLVGLVGSLVVWRLRLSHDVNNQLRGLRAAGMPTSGVELNNLYPPVPDAENAALVMTQAFALMRTFPDQRSNEVVRIKPPPRGQRLTTDQVELLSEYVQMNTATLAKVKQGLALPRSRYPIDLSSGAGTLLPHLSKLRTLAQGAACSAFLAIETEHASEAENATATILGLARTLDNEPLLISQLVRLAIINIAISSLERRLGAGELSEKELVHLRGEFAASEKTNLMARALIGERAIHIPYFRMSASEINRLTRDLEEGIGETPTGLPLSGTLFRVTGLFERVLNFFLQAMETNIFALSQPPPQSLKFTNSTEQNVLTARKNYYVFSALFLPAISKTAIKDAGASARLRTAAAAIGVERFRLANGRLPGDLRELVPGFLQTVPIDPFDGAPLRYKKLPKGYVVYSIGPDGHDDGGKEPPTKRRGTERVPEDITFTVER